MLGVTTYLSTDVAAVPLLWVVPLACYLLTFIVAFGWYSDGVRARAQRMLPHVLLPLVLLLLSESSLPLVLAVLVHVGAFTLISLLCHGQLALQRPGINHLTEFYLWLAAGGVLGGIFNTLIAPQVFTSVAEYPIAIVAGCLLCVSRGQVLDALANPRSRRRPAFAMAMAVALVIGGRMGGIAGPPILALLGAPALVCLSVAKDAARFALGITGLFAAFAIGNALVPSGDGQVLRAERTFFGVYRVKADPNRPLISLLHGTTIHGRQVIGDASPEPSTYYHRQSPIGQVLTARGDRARSIGVIGLGTGTLAAYVTPGAHWVFYEIDGAVERLARDARFFRYLERCGTQCDVVIGDARLTLARSQAAHDILILDAFSSDAIPVHLLTTEAVQTYEARLAESGVLAFHISNRHIQLRPVLGRLARARGLVAFARFDAAVGTQRGHAASDWVIMARRAETLSDLTHDARWTRLSADHRRSWSDDFSNIWSELQ
jgi:hypothetical protein